MIELLWVIQIGAPVAAAFFAYKTYKLVELERNIRIAREAAEEEEK